jgi:hypothetical protein
MRFVMVVSEPSDTVPDDPIRRRVLMIAFAGLNVCVVPFNVNVRVDVPVAVPAFAKLPLMLGS